MTRIAVRLSVVVASALAGARGGALVTTDYNLGRLAELQGVPVLNVNARALALRPGKRHLGQTLDVVVTSVLQTPAGRMIFSRPAAEAQPVGSPDG